LVLLELHGVRKTFGHGSTEIPAVRGVDLEVDHGETLGLVGESGCGKTTLGRVIVGLEEATAGEITFNGEVLDGKLSRPEYRRLVQMVFQHPAQSLNRRMRIATTLAEPLRLLRTTASGEIATNVSEALRLVGLGPDYLHRKPKQLSGGQQQRVAIARALMPNPDLVVLDEPTSSLDQSVRGRIIALLRAIQRERKVAYLFISHDLSTVRRIADRVAVMYLGRIVETASSRQIFEDPQHPYTQALLSAVPSLDLDNRRERIILKGETPSPATLPVGCSFQNRCPLVHDRCRQEQPSLVAVGETHSVECFAVTGGFSS
jgi:oligopeptide/dipeptide ABC transporter ATP-binding protein